MNKNNSFNFDKRLIKGKQKTVYIKRSTSLKAIIQIMI